MFYNIIQWFLRKTTLDETIQNLKYHFDQVISRYDIELQNKTKEEIVNIILVEPVNILSGDKDLVEKFGFTDLSYYEKFLFFIFYFGIVFSFFGINLNWTPRMRYYEYSVIQASNISNYFETVFYLLSIYHIEILAMILNKMVITIVIILFFFMEI